MIEADKVDEALEFFALNAEQIGQMKGRKDALDHLIKVEKARAFLAAPGNLTVAERNAIAECADRVIELIQEKQNCSMQLEEMYTYAKGYELTIQAYQTQSANRRAGTY